MATKRASRKIATNESEAYDLLATEKFQLANNLDFTSKSMKAYGEQTIENRAIPDYRDGLIPVQRRTLYAMYRQGSSNLVKSARVVGDVLGKWHPHGDTSAYGAMITLVQAPIKLIHGSGNWGSYDDPKAAAAMRYTECTLSDIARKVFFSGYLPKVYDLIPNFDSTEVEPAVLHCNIPVGLALGKFGGIAVGATCNFPSFALDGVVELTSLALGGTKVTPKHCMETLKFNFSWGGSISETSLKNGELLKVYKEGSGNLSFSADYIVNPKDGIMIIKSVPPGLSYTTAVTKTAEEGFSIDDFTTVGSDGIEIFVDLKSNKNYDKLKFNKRTQEYVIPETMVRYILKIWTGKSIPIRCAITDRQMTDEALESGASSMDIKFTPTIGIADYINKWAEYRLDLEVQMAKLEREDLEKQIKNLDLIIWARENLDSIKVALEKEDPILFISKKFKMDIEDVKYVFGRTLISLSKTDLEKSREKIRELKLAIKACAKRIKNPSAAAVEAAENVLT